MTQPTHGSRAFRHPVWWYRLTIVLILLGIGALLLSRGLTELPLFGRDWEHRAPDPTRILGLVLLVAVTCQPFLATVRWLIHRQRRIAGLNLSFWTAAGILIAVAWSGARYREGGFPPAEEAVELEDDPALALARAATVSCFALWFLWTVPPFLNSMLKVILLGGVTVLVGVSTYCLERARSYVTKDWLERNATTPISRRYSFRLRDYKPGGRRWLGFGVLAFVLWLLVLMVWSPQLLAGGRVG